MQGITTPSRGYSADTEILTRHGWITFDQLTYLDEVASRAPDGMFSWEYPDKILWGRHEGMMLHFRSQVYDLILVPDHPVMAYQRLRPDSMIDEMGTFRSASWLAQRSRGRNWRMPTTSRWKGSAPEAIVFPAVIPTRGVHHPARRLVIPVVTWMRFLGWFISEGSLSSAHHLRNQITVSQLRDECRPDIRTTLQGMGVSFRENSKGFEFNHGPLAAWLRAASYDDDGHRAWNKRIPDSVMGYTSDLLAEMFGSMMLGDGHVEKNGFRRYLTTSPGLADDVEELLQKMGTQGWHNVIHPRSIGVLGDYEIKGRRTQYRVNVRPGNGSAIPVPAEIAYSGMVGCASVPDRAIYVRRNGRTAWCG